MKKRDAEVVWRAIKRHLPEIAREVEAQAQIIRAHGRELSVDNFRWVERELEKIG